MQKDDDIMLFFKVNVLSFVVNFCRGKSSRC